MEITIKVPENMANGVIDAFVKLYSYQETIIDKDEKEIPNPQSKEQFTKEQVKNFVKEVFVGHQSNGAEITRKQLIEAAEADMKELTVE